ncbi:Gfo/Idh/MocA family protein [Tuwongella immobilis]|uniref:Uncharacterized protein n=1 Tax=Tuwongella immobilis TaxID=692036 RepID=A0A6C2YSL1_9BACT|nr:Gfo/Idh/MocA family oxidoreductase [Tuwongella immobilis]VIP04680.1 dehydrogenase : Putative dehydrogenase OS=Singulisphaera acidiphila (strain ATCC BAA-1392 / DSM 18658 / VKM B-2454 / MOB10) GN=Sinac_2714 PE=4 SV=1: GFO_IDH_MocA [Tuwongella immobilis]VTS06719.1 dehydrogenase : Putative dehydrogenase OS=Singulisphaera acidiphila (strain ATCC BAA-1392 / DSM 18658 / VKM B-2454 / MOB10) GN=Sinac_2714 PE=4 SV=1: GFO_IDH_MocA [Tuwongella immobilis]
MSESMPMGGDRRDFMKTATITGAALATTGFAGGVFAKGDETIKVGLIGCGGRGTGAADNILEADPNVRIVALGDVFPGKAKNALNYLKRKDAKRVTATEETCFDGLDNFQKVLAADVDLVILATPPGFRPTHLEAAVKAGKHIFTEKPVAVDGPGIRKCLALVEEAKNKKLGIVAGTQRRHQAGYLATLKQLHDGAIGDIVGGRCYWNQGDIWFRNRQKGQSDVQYQLLNWYHFLWLCGDHYVEQHVHNIDVINWVMKAHPVRVVTGMGGRSNRKEGPAGEVGHIFDHFAVEFEYPNGVVIQSYARQIGGTGNNVSEFVVGTKGTSQVNAYRINGKGVFSGEEVNPYVQEHIDLLASIRSGKPLNELQAVTESTLTAIMGRNAAYTGNSITWEQALNSKTDTMPANLKLDMALETAPTPVPGKTKIA